MTVTLAPALKEWAIAVEALTTGDTIMLLRKGGIREEGGRFTVAQRRVLLYPTFEHQQPHLLKEKYADRVQPVPSGWHPETIEIQAWAEITHIHQVSEAERIAALEPFHLWNQQFVTERLNWKPRQPLYVLLLRTYRLEAVQNLPFRAEYGGCRSWIEVSIDVLGANPAYEEECLFAQGKPALDDAAFWQRVRAIEAVLNPAQVSAERSPGY